MNIKSTLIKVIFCGILLLSSTLNAQQTQYYHMPMPANIKAGNGKLLIDKNFSISLEGRYDERLTKEASRFLRRLDQKSGRFFIQHKVTGETENAELVISVSQPGEIKLHEDESYSITVSPTKIDLKAKTDLGAIRGLETLLQSIEVEEGNYYFKSLIINDNPRFAWRGLMLDVSRHYMPMDVIYRNLDAMAAVKLNVLHLHLSDDQGFRFQSKTFPKLTEVASDGLYYTHQELRDIISYADQRGIRVMPEIDVPGHATAMLVAFPELGSKDTTYTLERYAGIFDPTLDPTKDEVYVFLKALFEEMSTIFTDDFFHIGGDENMGKHWTESKSIQEFKKKHNLADNHDLHTYFNLRLQKVLAELGKRTMGWEEIMTTKMPKSAVIHSWRGENEGTAARKSLNEAAKSGYETILSNGYYLDLMYSTADHYLVDPIPEGSELSDEEKKRILGGEMCMWSELVVPETIDSRLWPRAAAIAERLWSPGSVNDVDDMYRRLEIIGLELEELGLKHYTARSVILRKLTKGHDITPLRTLVEVVEPMKGYTRNPGGTMYATYSPFSLWADAATADAKVAREFNNNVNLYLAGNFDAKGLAEQLTLWKKNHTKVLSLIERSPVLLEIKELSENLSITATIGLEAIAFIEKDIALPAKWYETSKKSLEAALENGGRTELQVISGIKMLVNQVEVQVKQ
ncbi:beta-N-acetylhexosaminidase [Fulvivirga lutimaris]|uniref:beta-N-acetylhexosaminidase n=1 Tax=Fulvivirga lutimaris TaxID=1819566 RepID=UPI0012BD417A|nr:family 20 glycosylhydrolase [Fulvivirga lutimaris]MTI38784.1 beta-hexosaminidase [Fulvivirga lutimaris]